ncbi:hypothetical protein PVAND_015290 [Polypedilum vanderplanki]|uniref:Uncharacterized protein n=1 Tax=Polypedilum vanderplanki TaxID=319348 RepID=A0A9J6BCL1_POLVA|nr:hypothetical protein PVAND_015290 [Polypedilum vanderplanki]
MKVALFFLALSLCLLTVTIAQNFKRDTELINDDDETLFPSNVVKQNPQHKSEINIFQLYNIIRINEEKHKSQSENSNKKITKSIGEIDQNNIDKAVEIFNEINDDEDLKTIIQNAYSINKDNARNILKFSHALPYIRHSGLAYRKLFDEMQKNQDLDNSHIMQLAYYVHEAMNMTKFKTMEKEDKNIFENIKKSFPSGVRAIFWSGSVTIKNRYFSEYLYAPEIYYDHQRRNVFTWTNGQRINTGYWKMIPADSTGSNFYIKNEAKGEYLYAAGDSFNYDSQRRNVFLWTPRNAVRNGVWRVKPISSGDYFSIFNKYESEYLYAPGNAFNYDKNRRRVFTWIPRNAFNSKFHWKIY